MQLQRSPSLPSAVTNPGHHATAKACEESQEAGQFWPNLVGCAGAAFVFYEILGQWLRRRPPRATQGEDRGI